MARVTVEDCLEQIPNRFSLVLVASERTRQLLKGNPALVDNDQSNKEAVLALREIAAQKVTVDSSQFDENEALHTFAGPMSREDLPPLDGDALPPAADDDFDLPPAADDDFGLPPAADDDFGLPPEA
jgi:DNA-directed RNA polymerase subunit omega